MSRRKSLGHEFVEYLPERLVEGVLYVSMRFAIAGHRCCCGCGAEVVTPFSPSDWRITFDGKAVSLYPSIGNWSLKCRSHYWIREGSVIWARSWSPREVQTARVRERAERQRQFERAQREWQSQEMRAPRSRLRRIAERIAAGLLRR